MNKQTNRKEIAMAALRVAEMALAMLNQPKVAESSCDNKEEEQEDEEEQAEMVEANLHVRPAKKLKYEDYGDESENDELDGMAANAITNALDHMKNYTRMPKPIEVKAEEHVVVKPENEAENKKYKSLFRLRRSLTEEERELFISAVDEKVREHIENNKPETLIKQKNIANELIRGKFPASGYIKGVTLSPNHRNKYTAKEATYIHCAAAYFAEAGKEIQNKNTRPQGRYGTIMHAWKIYQAALKIKSPLSVAFVDPEASVKEETEAEGEEMKEVEEEPADRPVEKTLFEEMVEDVAIAVYFMHVFS